MGERADVVDLERDAGRAAAAAAMLVAGERELAAVLVGSAVRSAWWGAPGAATVVGELAAAEARPDGHAGVIPSMRTMACGLGTMRSARSLALISDMSRSKRRERSSSMTASARRTSTTWAGT